MKVPAAPLALGFAGPTPLVGGASTLVSASLLRILLTVVVVLCLPAAG